MKASQNIILIAALTFAVVLHKCESRDPEFIGDSMSDEHNNTADRDGKITFGPLPRGRPYKTDTTFNDGGIQLLYNMMHGWIDVVQPNELPYDLIVELLEGNIDITKDYKEVVIYGIGFAICFVLGILFVIIMPIVGCCFCCCRMCGNCGGRKFQKNDKNNRCRKIVYSVVLLILTIILGAGTACIFLTNERMAYTVENVGPIVEDNLGDVQSFVENTVDEIVRLAVDNFLFTSAVIVRDLINIGYLVGIPVRDELGSDGIDDALQAIQDFEKSISTLGTTLDDVAASKSALETSGTAFQTVLATAKGHVDTAQAEVNADGDCAASCSTIPADDLVMEVDYSTLPDLTTATSEMNDVRNQNLTRHVTEGKEEFENIPQRVINETKTVTSDIKGQLESFTEEIESEVESVTNLTNVVTDALDPIEKPISEFTDYATDVDQYRWYGFIGLGCLVGIITLLQLIGLICGIGGSNSKALPTERSCVSNCGGMLLMSAAGLIFIFSWLLMLLVAFLFIIGGNLDKGICEPLLDPEYKAIKALFDGPGRGVLANDGYFLGKTLLDDGSANLTFSGVLEGCRKDGAAYSVLQLDKLLNLDDITDYKSTINIEDEIDKIDVDLSSVTILNDDTVQQLMDFANALDIDYQGFVDELSKDTTVGNITTLSAVIRAASVDSANSAKVQGELSDAADALDTSDYQAIVNAQVELLADIQALNISALDVRIQINNTIDATRSLEAHLQNNGSEIIKKHAVIYSQRLLGIADQFVGATITSMKNDVGKCLPVWNLWESLVHNAVCRYTIDSINLFWFSLGWCVFFMIPSVIFNVKLAKYFRRMTTIEGYDDPPPSYDAQKAHTLGSPPHMSNDKASPQASAPRDYNYNGGGYDKGYDHRQNQGYERGYERGHERGYDHRYAGNGNAYEHQRQHNNRW